MFEYIEKLESHYRKTASHFACDFNAIMRLRERLQRRSTDIVLYIKGLERNIPATDKSLITLLNKYLSDFKQIHKQNMDCLTYTQKQMKTI